MGERGEKLGPSAAASTGLEEILGHQCSHFLSEGRRNELVDRYTFARGQFAHASM